MSDAFGVTANENKIAIGELKSKVAYSFQQPYTRNFGFEKSANKNIQKTFSDPMQDG